MNDIKKAALVEEGQPADLTAQRKATEAYHADGNLSNERDRALEWLHKMATAQRAWRFSDDIMLALFCDGVHMTGLKKVAELIGAEVKFDERTYENLIEISFVYDGVKFYELHYKDVYEED